MVMVLSHPTIKPAKKQRLRAGTSIKALRQRTLDTLDKQTEQDVKFGPRQSAALAVQLDSAALEGFDRMVVLDALRDDPGCTLVMKQLKCSRDEAAERMLALVEQGFMTIGIHEGRVRVGITSNGWKEVSRKLR
jgi:hypothetical protein